MRHLPALLAATLLALGAAAPASAAGPPLQQLACVTGTELVPHDGATARGERDTTGIVPDSQIPDGQAPDTTGFAATVPVWFHVLAEDRTARGGWVTDDQVRRQVDVLNAAFAGSGTGFRFVLEGVTRTVNARWHRMETLADELEAKRALRRGDSRTLNVFSTSPGVLGFAYYPKIVAGGYGGYQDLDAVVIHFGSMPGGKIKHYDLGHTATHEVGHWLGLPHTFEQGCRGHGDFVDDTPAMAVPTAGCPVGKDTCPAPGTDPIHNYMDYSYDACYAEFTPGQAERMQQQWLHWRVKHGYSGGGSRA